MDDDERAIYDHMLISYRNQLDVANFELAKALAQMSVKDRMLEQLTEPTN